MASAGAYGADFAGLYDLFHGSKRYADEARFIGRVARRLLSGRKGLRLLDVACGTGTHAVEFSRMGFAVTGVDGSAEMVRHARRKARAAGAKIRFEQQELTALSMPPTFDVVTCLFDSIGYLHADGAIRRALRRMRQALAPGGLLFAEAWHAPAMLEGFDPIRVRRVSGGGAEAVRIGETRVLPARRAAEVRYEVFHRKGNGAWRRFVETHVTRFFTEEEIRALAESAGFRVAHILGGYDDALTAGREAWHLLVIAEGR